MPQNHSKRFELMVVGKGGQGALLLGRLLVEAGASHYRNALYFPNYGFAMRGGESECTVILSNDVVYSPTLLNPQAAIVMGKAALEQFEERIPPGGLLLIDGSLTREQSRRRDISVYSLPATETAVRIGDSRAANLVLLGAYLGITGAVPLELVEQGLEKRLRSAEMLALNKRGLREGARLVAEGPSS